MARQGKRYTDEQYAFVRQRYADMTNRELGAAFEAAFPGSAFDRKHVIQWARSHHIRKSPETLHRTHTQCAARVYTDEQREFLRGYIPGHTEAEIMAAYEQRYGVTLTRGKLNNLKTMLGVNSGTNGGRFERGNVPANRGKTWDEYMPPEAQERVRASGNLCGRGHQPHNQCHELLDMREDDLGTWIYLNPRDAKYPAAKWVAYARFVWMADRGRDFPDGCRCVHCNHDDHDFRPENLMAVPNDLYGIITGGLCDASLEYWDRESLKLAITHAKLLRKTREIECKRPRRCAVCGRTFVPDEKRARYGDRVRTCQSCRERGLRAPARRREEG